MLHTQLNKWDSYHIKKAGLLKTFGCFFASRDTTTITAMLKTGYSCGTGMTLRRPGIRLKQFLWVDIQKTSVSQCPGAQPKK